MALIAAALIGTGALTAPWQTRVFLNFGGFGPVIQIESTSPEQAREGAKYMRALDSALNEFRLLIVPAPPMKPRGSVRLAVSLPEGWVYVDENARVWGARSGGFDVLGWERLARRRLPALPASDTLIIELRNASKKELRLVDSAGLTRAVLAGAGRTRVLTWFGPHRFLIGGAVFATVDRLFGSGTFDYPRMRSTISMRFGDPARLDGARMVFEAR